MLNRYFTRNKVQGTAADPGVQLSLFPYRCLVRVPEWLFSHQRPPLSKGGLYHPGYRWLNCPLLFHGAVYLRLGPGQENPLELRLPLQVQVHVLVL